MAKLTTNSVAGKAHHGAAAVCAADAGAAYANAMKRSNARRKGKKSPLLFAAIVARARSGSAAVFRLRQKLFTILMRHIDRIDYAGWIGCEYNSAGDTVEGLAWAKPYL